jgi:hypothetical protein
VAWDENTQRCRTEHAQKFDPTVGLIFIALGVAATIAIAVSTSGQNRTQ